MSPRTARIGLAALTLTLALSAPTSAHAQQVNETRRTGAFEFKLGNYYPERIDAESGGSFSTFFGETSKLYGEFVWERDVWQRVGTASVGLHAGFARRTGEVRTVQTGEGTGSDDIPGETIFRVIPLRLSAAYDYDYSAIHHGVPLVPFARLGVDYYLWRVLDGEGETATFDGSEARGGKAGWHGSLGLKFMLDYANPASASSFDMNWGINNSYLFGEYMITRINGFGAAGFDLSDEQWLFGLAFDF